MSKGFWIASAAAIALGAPGIALAQPQHHAPPPTVLPDFPPDAEPGACYARIRGEGPAAEGPAVWTLKRGHGPEAVWSYSEPGSSAPHASGYRWVRVLCKDGMTPFQGAHAHAGGHTGTTGAGLEPLPPLAAPPPPPPHVVEVRPHGHGPHVADVRPDGPDQRVIVIRPRGHAHPGPQHEGPPPPHAMPFAHGPMVEPPPPGPHFSGPPPHIEMHPPMGPHHAGPPMPPPVQPRWFGDRYLHWAGKRPAVW